MKKGRRCPYCGRIITQNMANKKWECVKCGDVDAEVNKVKAGEYR